MNRAVLAISAAACGAAALSLTAGAWAQDGAVSLRTHIRQTTAVQTGDGRVQKLEVEIVPELHATLPAAFELTGIVRFRVDPLDRLEPGRPDEASYFPASRRLLIEDEAEAELRELYLERSFRRAYLTLGKQQVVWGKADGIKLLDVVNPQSFREFILPDFEDSRIPLWTLNLEVPVGPISAQLLWIPDNTVHDLPEEGAAYELTSSLLVPVAPLPNLQVTVEKERRPRDFFSDSDGGIRISGSAGRVDFTLNYLYQYYDVPVLHRTLGLGPTGLAAVITPRYERTHVAGFSLATTLGKFTLRSEAAAFTDRFVSTTEAFDADGLVTSDEYSYMVGVDWFGLESTFLSAQLFQSFMPDLAPLAIRDEMLSVVTLVARRTFAHEQGVAQAMLLLDPDRCDGLARGRIGYDVLDDVNVAVGGDFFFGVRRGIFGQFDGRDRVLLEISTAF